ncbi:hypothetical protein ES707_18984 [subsurface metagenome]
MQDKLTVKVLNSCLSPAYIKEKKMSNELAEQDGPDFLECGMETPLQKPVILKGEIKLPAQEPIIITVGEIKIPKEA